MKIKEIDDHALYRVAGQIQIEPMAFFFVPRAHVFHIFIAPLLLAGICYLRQHLHLAPNGESI
jgi:hypothetical protein